LQVFSYHAASCRARLSQDERLPYPLGIGNALPLGPVVHCGDDQDQFILSKFLDVQAGIGCVAFNDPELNSCRCDSLQHLVAAGDKGTGANCWVRLLQPGQDFWKQSHGKIGSRPNTDFALLLRAMQAQCRLDGGSSLRVFCSDEKKVFFSCST